MKKYLILFLFTGLLSFTACSDDDEAGPKNEDPIVGTWVITSVEPAQFNIEACEEASTITFNEDNTGSATFYLEETNCIAANASGDWSNNGGDSYTITVPVAGSMTGTIDFSGANQFFFVTENGVTITFQRQ